MKIKEKALPVLNFFVSAYLTGEAAVRGDLPSTITNAINLVESFKNVFNKRLYGFTISVAQLSEEIEKHQNNFIENLPHNEKFISAFMQGSLIAARNHQKEKLDALRNAVLNTALLNDPNEDLQLSFIGYIDRLTPTHLAALKDYHDSLHLHNVNINEIETKYSNFLDELEGLGLLIWPPPSDLTGSSPHMITDKGEKFLDFIKSPLEKIKAES